MEIPFDRLSPEVLRGVIEEYVSREGTDYGTHEHSLDEKVEDVMRQLQRGTAAIVFNPEDESCDIVAAKH